MAAGKRRISGLFAFALAAAVAVAAPRAASPEAASAKAPADPAKRVVILANSSAPGSFAIALHYAEVRHVPKENILSLAMTADETISWPEFVTTIWQPVQDELVRRGWIDALALSGFDSIGRKKYAVSGHRIAALVVCRGVPLRIEDDPGLRPDAAPLTERPQLRTNAGAVDSEFSLLAADGGYPIEGFVPNPLFQKRHSNEFDRAKVVIVGRLDGPTVEEANGLVDRAVAAEKAGLAGRAYVDIGGHYPDGDTWLASAAAEIAGMGFDTYVDREPTTIPNYARFDAPVLYFGWYAPNVTGPFTLPGFRFPQGAIALHIYSFSARTLRSAEEAWCGPFVARGVTATLGNVWEPYLQFTHRPDLLFWALSHGATLGEAAYYAVPVLSWQAILIGDPLYRPFAVSLGDQLDHPERLPGDLFGYAVMRQVHLLDAYGQASRGTALLRKAFAARPGLALGVALAARLKDAGGSPEAVRVLESAVHRGMPRPDQWALARDAAELLSAVGRPELAEGVYRRLLAINALPLDLRGRWLVDAKRAALAAKDPSQAAEWKQALSDAVERMVDQKD